MLFTLAAKSSTNCSGYMLAVYELATPDITKTALQSIIRSLGVGRLCAIMAKQAVAK